MPVIPNMRRTFPNALQHQAPPVPLALVDTPAMDYAAWLGRVPGPIADIDGGAARRIAVVGAGAAGMAAAYELLRCGLDVTIFEASDRIGGRLLSSPSSSGDGTIFEMSAMRFTPSERLLHYYADLFTSSGASKVEFGTGAFPDPGGGDTTYIAFQSKTYVHAASHVDKGLPPSAAIVSAGWKALLTEGFRSADGTIRLVAPDAISGMLASEQRDLPAIRAAWQAYIDHFGQLSVFEAMVRIFADPTPPGGRPWSDEDLQFFGAVGTGVGGFGPLFPIGFVDIMRSVVNAVDSDQHELLTGVESLIAGFLDQPIGRADGAVTRLRDHIVTGTPVLGVASQAGRVALTFGNGKDAEFDRVVVATSHRSMELTMGLGHSAAGLPLAVPVADAVRRLHISNSSKVFVETRDFWSEPASDGSCWPRNVVSDTILRNLYVLTYPNAPPGTGALLLSYAWADDALKQQTFTDPQARLGLLLADLATISPEFCEIVRENIKPETVQTIDWQTKPWYFGAFKLGYPGHDAYVQSLFYDFRKAGGDADTGVYLAGDSIGFLGAWVENALETGVNAAAAVAHSLGGRFANWDEGPFEKLQPNVYDYGRPRNSFHR